jgi:hypothetical protein
MDAGCGADFASDVLDYQRLLLSEQPYSLRGVDAIAAHERRKWQYESMLKRLRGTGERP